MATTLQPAWEDVRSVLADWRPFEIEGRVRSVVGLLVEAEGIAPPIGAFCEIAVGSQTIDAEVVGLRGPHSLLLPLHGVEGLGVGARVRVRKNGAQVPTGRGCLGRVLDGIGRPIDGGRSLEDIRYRPLEGQPVNAVRRSRIDTPLDFGVRAIDAFATVGEGMRMGVFAGSGVGKSTLLGQLASQAQVDVCVIALIGERRREVREFIERDLGEALSRSVVVVSTSDESAALRSRAARVATSIAEGFRDEGARVLLMMDSLTRFCTAQREIGLAVGEPPTTRGYTPSVWSALPKLVERAGTSVGRGCITGLYTVLVEGDDMNEPVADAARSLLDGHIELSRKIAERGQYPAIDVLRSVSRVMPDVATPAHLAAVRVAREILSIHRDAEDLIAVGAYQEGTDASIDRARLIEPQLRNFLRQGGDDRTPLEESIERLCGLVGGETK